MVIVLVKWKIKPDHKDEFLASWKETYRIKNLDGLIGEFLCSPDSQPYITWCLPDPGDPPCCIFVNVGLWSDVESFRKQVEPNFNDNKMIEKFEAARRTRAVLTPAEWRIGKGLLLEANSTGVL